MNASRRVVHLRLRPGGRARAAVAVAGAVLALTACTATNEQQTKIPFDPADGRSAQIGGTDTNSGVQLRNFLIVTTAQGAPGRVVGAIANRTPDQAQVRLAVVATGTDGQQQAVGQTTVTVAPGGFVQVGSPSTATASGAAGGSNGGEPAAGQTVSFDLATVPAPPGAVLQLVANTDRIGGTSLNIPVLPATGYYQTLAPSASPSAQPSTVTPTGAPSPSANPSGAAKQTPNRSNTTTDAAKPSASATPR